MMPSKELDDILDDCLEQLRQGESVEQCLARFPAYADQLRTLLETASDIKKAVGVRPRPEFRANARLRLQSALNEIVQKQPQSLFGRLRQPQWAAAVTGILVLFVAGSTAALANNSMPDSPLYPMKLAMERLQVSLTRSTDGKAELYARLMERRVTEISKMADENKPDKIEQVTQRLDAFATSISALTTITAVPEAKVTAPVAAPTPAPPAAAPGIPAGATPPAGITATAPAANVAPPLAGQAEVAVPSPAAANTDMTALKTGDTPGQSKSRLAGDAAASLARLQALLDTAPEAARPAIRNAIAAAEKSYEAILRYVNNN